ncbi:hypothetical protein I8J29_22610 [Paenibacillus sp. MWE-103]|uniref:Aldouronate transport system substrate-binding protein n=1 Tax=Paenibacillus artemisiicola TaxID=1172618 RepID=A0ABS3WFB4_9BACL|nr:hypothetical protein [Paenibacillus artemisiicola]MBO7747000.1 hypothetical protein [Paenibacillus artemisiicola]
MKSSAKVVSSGAALILAVSLLSGCSGNGNTSRGNNTSANQGTNANEAGTTNNSASATDGKYVPEKDLNLKVWYTWADTAPTKGPSEDVVSPEIKKITKVNFTQKDIIVNNGVTGLERLNMYLATGDLPHVIYAQRSSSEDIIKKLVEADKVWNLDDYLAKYAPNVLKRVTKDAWDSTKIGGKIYGIPSDVAANTTNAPELKGTTFEKNSSGNGAWQLVVRDDILKAYDPSAKSVAELGDALKKNGTLSYDDMKVNMRTPDDLMDFLQKSKGMNMKTVNGKDVVPLDMWTQGWWIGPWSQAWGFAGGSSGPVWDDEKNTVYWAPATEDYKNYLKWLHTAYQNKLMDQETFTMSDDQRTSKLNNGQYAVTHFWQDINALNDTLKKNGEKFQYRLIQAPANTIADSPQYDFQDPRGGNFIMISKSVPEDELKQILNWIDFQYSEEGETLMSWGPESAGLWEVKDGKRKFKDPALDQNALLGTQTDKDLAYYGLSGGNLNQIDLGRLIYTHDTIRGYKSIYETPKNVDNPYGEEWNVLTQATVRPIKMDLTGMFINQVPEWGKLTGEDGVIGCMKNEWAKAIVADNDANFEKYYEAGMKRLKDLGLDKATTDLTKLITEYQTSVGK